MDGDEKWNANTPMHRTVVGTSNYLWAARGHPSVDLLKFHRCCCCCSSSSSFSSTSSSSTSSSSTSSTSSSSSLMTIESSQSGSKPYVFDTFDFQMCLSLRRRAFFRHRIAMESAKSGPNT